MGAESPAVVGRYRRTASGQWEWSEAMYGLFGFAPGEVVPTPALMTHHQHPEDRPTFERLLTGHVEDGHSFAWLGRLVDTAGRERWVAWTADPREPGTQEVEGRAADVTEQQQRVVAERANWHVDRALASREVIDQAKGVLMVVYRTSSDDAFGLLRWASQRGNVKLTALAGQLLDAVRAGLDLGPTARQRVDDVVSSLLAHRDGPDGAGGADGAEDGDGTGAPVPQARSPLDVRLGTEGRAPVLTVTGEVDLSTAPQLSSALNQLTGAGRTPLPVLVDLSGTTHLGSVGISMLLVAQRRCEAAGTPLRVVTGPGAAAASIAATSGLALYPTRAAALGA